VRTEQEEERGFWTDEEKREKDGRAAVLSTMLHLFMGTGSFLHTQE